MPPEATLLIMPIAILGGLVFGLLISGVFGLLIAGICHEPKPKQEDQGAKGRAPFIDY